MSPPTPHEPCPPVTAELGSPPELGLMRDPAFDDEISALTTNVEAAYHWGTGETPAARALIELGCNACAIAGVCLVKERLEENAQAATETQKMESTAQMLIEAPSWLQRGRQSLTGLDETTLVELLTSDDPNGPFTLEAMRAGVKNETLGKLTANELPELTRLPGISPDTIMEVQRVTADNGDSFDVVDARDALGYKGIQPSGEELNVLYGKMLSQMVQKDAQDNAQILKADTGGTSRKTIFGFAPHRIDEVRMGSKSRLYVALTPLEQADAAARITILGTHGDKAAAQRAFLGIIGM